MVAEWVVEKDTATAALLGEQPAAVSASPLAVKLEYVTADQKVAQKGTDSVTRTAAVWEDLMAMQRAASRESATAVRSERVKECHWAAH